VTHQTVGAGGRADILLHVHHGLVLERSRRQRRRDPRGRFERGALRHVDHDLELALVVERKHLHGDQAERHECHRPQQQDGDASEEERAHPAARHERTHHASI
jgi:hypothetical protein